MQSMTRATKPKAEPHVAIFWLFQGKVLIDSTPVSTGEPYGDCIGHPTSHIRYWAKLQQTGAVPPETEYEEPPRGRVAFDKRTGQFLLMADKCIRERKDVLRKIILALGLPSDKTFISDDPHYRCAVCLRRRRGQE
jgi:hypothetical protein